MLERAIILKYQNITIKNFERDLLKISFLKLHTFPSTL